MAASTRSPIIGVMGPDKDSSLLPLAEELGKALAEAGYMAGGGTTIGIIPGYDLTEASPYVDIPIITGLGSARNNVNALSSQVLVAVGSGPGTAAEVALALKAGRHVVLMAGSEESHKFFASMSPASVHVAADVAAALVHINNVVKA